MFSHILRCKLALIRKHTEKFENSTNKLNVILVNDESVSPAMKSSPPCAKPSGSVGEGSRNTAPHSREIPRGV